MRSVCERDPCTIDKNAPHVNSPNIPPTVLLVNFRIKLPNFGNVLVLFVVGRVTTA